MIVVGIVVILAVIIFLVLILAVALLPHIIEMSFTPERKGETSTKEGGNAARNAWVTLVMLGDAYTPGALALASSLKRTGTKHAIVCMVTEDVSKDARSAMAQVFDEVVEIPYITKATTYPRSEKQKKIYTWVDKSLTKWACLKLTKYKRVIFLDADIIALTQETNKNMDDLFDLRAPAGCFSSPWAYPYTEKKGIMNPYLDFYRRTHKGAMDIPHGVQLPAKLLHDALFKPTFTLLGAVVLLETDEKSFDGLMALVNKTEVYGEKHKIVANTAEEAAIVDYFAGKGIPWTHIHQKYEAVPRKPSWTKDITDIRAHHFLGAHPWAMARDAWPDLKSWWDEAAELMKENPELSRWFAPRLIGEQKTGTTSGDKIDSAKPKKM